MASYSVSKVSRGPVLVLLVVIILVYALRYYLSVPSSDSLVERTGTRKQISLLAWNIYFPSVKMRERMEALGQIVQKLEPDILALQEVTPENLALLRNQPWFSRYHMIPPDISNEVDHSVVILSVFTVDKWFPHPFKKAPYTNRKIITAELKNTVSSPRFVVGVTHLVHARQNTLQRELQLKETLQVLSPYDNVCVMGDMNIQSGRTLVDGVVVLPSSWIDVWLSFPGNTDDNGYTYDQSKNPFVALKRKGKSGILKARCDRVFCKLSDFKVKEMRIVGEELTKSKIVPSDHYGLFTVIEQSENTDHKHGIKSPTEKEVYFKRPAGWEKLVGHKTKSN